MPKRGRRAAFIVAGVASLSVGVAAVSASFAANGSPGPSSEVVVAHGDSRLPGDSLRDWVTYGDHVVVAEISDEVQDAGDVAAAAERGEGCISRSAKVRVTNVLWSRSGAPAAPAQFQTDLAGWVDHDGDRQKFVLDGSSRIESGHRYLLPITLLEGTGWAPMNPTAVMPFDLGVIGIGEKLGGAHGALDATLNGVSSLLLVPQLLLTAPLAGVDMSIADPEQRYEAAAS